MPANPKARVIIRALTAADGPAFIAAVRRSHVLHATWVNPKARTRKKFADYLARFSTGHRHGFLVVKRDTQELVGMINLTDVVRGNSQSAVLGYYAFTPHAGQGLMREAMRLVLRQAFGKLKLHRVEAAIQPTNQTSIALVQKYGFVREGVARGLFKMGGRWRDHERWALLAEDFSTKSR